MLFCTREGEVCSDARQRGKRVSQAVAKFLECLDMAMLMSMPPIVPDRPRLLILGSMPGQYSLNVQQYYANPTNCFWYIMGRLFDFPSNLPYERRVAEVKQSGVALWDVLQFCERTGSGDAKIKTSSAVANDISDLIAKHSTINAVYFNGRKSEQMFLRLVRPSLDGRTLKSTKMACLPSTSAAHASFSKERKLEAWKMILECATE